jgi:hypothetical protein
MDISRSIEDAVGSYFYHWLQEHQLIWWLIGHPVWSLVILFLSIALFVGLLGAIRRSIEQLWIGLLRTPLRMIQCTVIWIRQKISRQQSITSLYTPDSQINVLVSRLLQIQQEQDKLMQELLKIVKAKS